MNPYEVLGVSKTATQDEIKKAYRKLASQNHPDKGGDTARFQQIQNAYDILSDPEKRQNLDNPKSAHQNFNFHFDHPNIEEIFAQFGFHNTPFARVHPRKNQDIRAAVNLNLEDTLIDSVKNILIHTSNQQKTLEIRIPKGITSGTTIKYPDLGDNLFPNLPPGDLYLTININYHPRFQISGLDLITNLTIDCFQAILGCEQTIIGLDNKVFSIKIPAGCQPNTKLKIPGEGLNAFQHDIKGNLLIQILINIPTDLNENQKNLLIELQNTR